MRILLVNNAEKNRREFVEPIELLFHDKILFDSIEYSEIPKARLEDYSAIISSASPRGNDIVETHARVYEWVKTTDKPFLGICAGHQIIGRLFGAQIIRNKEQEIGDLPVSVDVEDPIFAGLGKTFLVRQGHNDSITIPEQFTLLAHSDKCKVQVMKHHEKPIYSCQFHAEVLNPKLILNFVKMI